MKALGLIGIDLILANQKLKRSGFLFGIPLSQEVSNLTYALFVPFILEGEHLGFRTTINFSWCRQFLHVRKEIAVGSSVRIVSTDSTESIIPESRVVNGETRLLLGPALTKPEITAFK